VCKLNKNEVLILSGSACILSLLTMEIKKLKYIEKNKKIMVDAVANNFEVNILYDNNTVKVFQIE
jgi:hypothetical protein